MSDEELAAAEVEAERLGAACDRVNDERSRRRAASLMEGAA